MLRNPFIYRPDLAEITQYVKDLERITLLRDKSLKYSDEEHLEYSNIIKVMQLTLVYLNERVK